METKRVVLVSIMMLCVAWIVIGTGYALQSSLPFIMPYTGIILGLPAGVCIICMLISRFIR